MRFVSSHSAILYDLRAHQHPMLALSHLHLYLTCTAGSNLLIDKKFIFTSLGVPHQSHLAITTYALLAADISRRSYSSAPGSGVVRTAALRQLAGLPKPIAYR